MSTLAINGGTPVRTRPFLGWPVFGREEEEALLAALRSGTWGSLDGTFVKRLEVGVRGLPGRAPRDLLRQRHDGPLGRAQGARDRRRVTRSSSRRTRSSRPPAPP